MTTREIILPVEDEAGYEERLKFTVRKMDVAMEWIRLWSPQPGVRGLPTEPEQFVLRIARVFEIAYKRISETVD